MQRTALPGSSPLPVDWVKSLGLSSTNSHHIGTLIQPAWNSSSPISRAITLRHSSSATLRGSNLRMCRHSSEYLLLLPVLWYSGYQYWWLASHSTRLARGRDIPLHALASWRTWYGFLR